MKNFYIINLNKYIDERGTLLPFEYNNNCPFEIKRCFVISDVPNKDVNRANHVNTKSKMLLIPLQGSFEICCRKPESIDSLHFFMDSPSKALFIDSGVFRKMYNFSKDAIVLCLSNEYYESEEDN